MKTKILLNFPNHLADKPITYRLIKDYDLAINILRASIDYNVEGKLLLEVIGSVERIDQAVDFLRNEGITVNVYKKQVIRNEEECIHCGACTAVCSIEALHFNPDRWKMEFDAEKCLVCGLCVQACPLRIIEVAL